METATTTGCAVESVGEEFGFECATCGAYHVGMASFGWDWPVQYLMVPGGERAARVELGPDDCVIDGEWFFVRGCLEVPVRGRGEAFSWGAWVSLSREGFAAYAALHANPGREPGARFVGWLSSLFPGYPDPGDEPLKAALHVRPWPLRPLIELEPTDYPLAVEQREGITPERVREIAERVMHPPPGGAHPTEPDKSQSLRADPEDAAAGRSED